MNATTNNTAALNTKIAAANEAVIAHLQAIGAKRVQLTFPCREGERMLALNTNPEVEYYGYADVIDFYNNNGTVETVYAACCYPTEAFNEATRNGSMVYPMPSVIYNEYTNELMYRQENSFFALKGITHYALITK